MSKKQSGNKKNRQSNFAKLSIFQSNKYKFKKSCPLSVKRYISENKKNLNSSNTTVSKKTQRELALSIKRARNLALL